MLTWLRGGIYGVDNMRDLLLEPAHALAIIQQHQHSYGCHHQRQQHHYHCQAGIAALCQVDSKSSSLDLQIFGEVSVNIEVLYFSNYAYKKERGVNMKSEKRPAALSMTTALEAGTSHFSPTKPRAHTQPLTGSHCQLPSAGQLHGVMQWSP